MSGLTQSSPKSSVAASRQEASSATRTPFQPSWSTLHRTGDTFGCGPQVDIGEKDGAALDDIAMRSGVRDRIPNPGIVAPEQLRGVAAPAEIGFDKLDLVQLAHLEVCGVEV